MKQRGAGSRDFFLERVGIPTSTGCWPWLGATRKTDGYGVFSLGPVSVPAHRAAWMFFRGAMPPPYPMTLDHLCRNPGCVNPAHLELVTTQENTRRGNGPSAINARMTHCRRGHPLSGENLLYVGGDRRCRICRNASKRTPKHQSPHTGG